MSLPKPKLLFLSLALIIASVSSASAKPPFFMLSPYQENWFGALYTTSNCNGLANNWGKNKCVFVGSWCGLDLYAHESVSEDGHTILNDGYSIEIVNDDSFEAEVVCRIRSK